MSNKGFGEERGMGINTYEDYVDLAGWYADATSIAFGAIN
jgi:hypothetical protein